MIRYEQKEPGLLYVYFTGTVSVQDIHSHLSEFESFDFLPDKIMLLYDLQDVNLKLDLEDVSIVNDLAEKVTKKYKSVKTAFVVSKPHATALTMMFQSDISSAKTTRKVFSTDQAALEWLKS
jgi:hypothetical protein